MTAIFKIFDFMNTVRAWLAVPVIVPEGSAVVAGRLERRYRLALPPRVALYGVAAALLWLHLVRTGPPGGALAPPLLLFFASAVAFLFRRVVVVDRERETVAFVARVGAGVTYRTLPFSAIDCVALEADDEEAPDAVANRPVVSHRVRLRRTDGGWPERLLLSRAFHAARAEAVTFALALRKPLVERLAGAEVRRPPEELARPWLENAIAGPEPPDAPPHRAVTEATRDGVRRLVVRRRHAWPGWALFHANLILCAAAALLPALQSGRGEPIAVVAFVFALILHHSGKAIFGTLEVVLDEAVLEVRDRFLVERGLYAMRWERLHDLTPVAGREAALHFLSGGGDFALPLPVAAAQDLARRIALFVRDASRAPGAESPAELSGDLPAADLPAESPARPSAEPPAG